MNNVTLIGRLTTDPELRTTGTGKSVVNVNIAVDRFAVEEDKQSVDFIPIQVWGKLADNLANYQSKGSQIAVEGSFRADNYTDKDGNNRTKYCVLANRIEFLSSRKEAKVDSEVEEDEEFNPNELSLDDDDLPF